MRDPGIDLHLGGIRRTPGGVGRSLEEALREAVRTGRLAPGARLPGTRRLATDLGLARGTVVQVYTQLIAEGWLVGNAGSSTRVAPATTPQPATTSPSPPSTLDLSPGRPDISTFPRTAWTASIRRTLSTADRIDFDYGNPAGHPALRAAIADYVARTRGVQATPDAVVITCGFSHALAALAHVFHDQAITTIATENPNLPLHRDWLTAAGLTTTPLTVDTCGANPADLSTEARAALLTPNHQFPQGYVLSPPRRKSFVDWATRVDGYLIEDDYDGEFRYDQRPVGALQALAPDRVIFAGSTSKTMAPGVRIGWLVLPPALRNPVRTKLFALGATVPSLDQLALADLITHGDYDRHIRRARLSYRRRRNELVTAIESTTKLTVRGIPAGLQALLPLDSIEQETQLVAKARAKGLLLQGMHAFGYWHDQTPNPGAALVLGFATPAPHAWRRTLQTLLDTLD
ncbi:MocR-like pyridoxine biosynthesis transcription factor PdxR [Crossiella cryophila]|uniref:GntR family transcriptional regulator/MocR family aminotransferase n=1 Tax=Crossiella cryophila TaxID=43355 RepID=A0A7W7CC64_9PSEU|nr:PLP-dependent aminotransferase family protein [Crossiella cryophila]MBB4678317.1 GntR family transcriptional regulator/MocR family aminotransferase [Crossiella cryophila]